MPRAQTYGQEERFLQVLQRFLQSFITLLARYRREYFNVCETDDLDIHYTVCRKSGFANDSLFGDAQLEILI
jgi:hypothetical protein